MALAATQMALKDASFDPGHYTASRMGVVVATAFGGHELGEQEMQALWEKGPGFVGAYHSTTAFYAATAAHISIAHGIQGPVRVISAEGTGGLEALAQARRFIRRGADAVISGGTEAPLTPFALTAQALSGRLSHAQDPAAGYRPFDVGANGYVPGEGAAILLVEELEQARRRGVPQVYGEIAGHGASHDAHHHTGLAPDAGQLARAISLALADTGMNPEDVDAIFADAAGTLEGDMLEARAIMQVFGDRASRVPVAAPKSMVGRLYAAGSALDAAAALLSIRDQCLPPIVNLSQPARGCNLDVVTNGARSVSANAALVNARGLGGFNSALLLRRVS
jgi:minimal PKS chain-length factor (CLF/KS beta)